MKTCTRFLLIIALCVAFSFLAFPPTTLAASPDGWNAIEPGFSVQALLGRGTAMWAAGSGESIAVSTDAGRHWQRKHQDPKGALLLVLNFVDDKFGYAAGTGGKVLFTIDGGETWTVKKLADESILQAAFGDAQHGVVRTLSALLSTTDGGKTWQPIVPANDPDWVSKFPVTIGMAALNGNHLAVRVGEGPLSDGEYLWTGDGGVTWSANYIPNAGIHDLFVSAGNYLSIGHEVLGKDRPGGGYGVASAFRSADGVQWEHISLREGACKSESCGGCTAQGCFLSQSSFVIPQVWGSVGQSTGDWLATFPARAGLSSQYAKSGNTLCLLSSGIVECASIQPAKTADLSGDPPTWAANEIPAIGRARKSNPQCIRCQLNPMAFTKTGSSGPVDVQISFTLEASGLVDDIAIRGNLPDDVIRAIREEAKSWLFEPFLKDGVPTATTLGMRGRIMVMNPEKPPAGPTGMPLH